jgi:3-oxoacyl-[acyl-carrier protein] reductase
MNIKDAKVLVTGGSSGIGYEIAHRLKLAGAEVTICGRNAESLFKASTELGVNRIQADVSVEADVIRCVQTAREIMDGLNVLINNAGYGIFSPLVNLDIEKMDAMMATNVRGLVLMGREAAKIFTAQNYGNIINLSSTAGLSGFAAGTAYVASKFAVKGITECWRAELRKHNIRVMLINPSEVQTNFIQNSGRDEKAYNPSKLEAQEIAHLALSMLQMRDVGFITEATVFATNPKEG